MIFGLTLLVFIHTLISLVAIVAGILVVHGLLTAKACARLTAWFLALTAATCLSGFILPAVGFLPSHAVGILTMAFVAVAAFARYSRHLAGAWRWIFAAATVVSLYLNVFVLIVQAFLKVPALHALAPTGGEPAFKIAHLVVLAIFAVLTIGAAIRFRPATARAA